MGNEVILLLIISLIILAIIVYKHEKTINETNENNKKCLEIMGKMLKVLSLDEDVVNSHADLISKLVEILFKNGNLNEADLEEITKELGE